MKTRIAALSLALVACGGSKFFHAADKSANVKKVALVQYAINPHLLLGAAALDDSKFMVAAQNAEAFGKELGNTYQITPVAELLADPAYTGAGGKPTFDGYYSGKGMHYFSADEESLVNATLTPEVAKKLCEALKVDAVVAIYDSWNIQTFAMGFQGHTLPEYTINMYDKEGQRVWGGAVSAESSIDFGTPSGVPDAKVEVWANANTESFTLALSQVKTSIGAK